MFDEKGRVWITSRVRPPDNPDFCKAGSSHPSARLFPLNASGRHLAVYDPKTKEMKHISTCFGTHHLMFAEDANRTLWTERRRAGDRVVEHEAVGRDGRRGEGAGMDRADPGHQRERPPRRVRGAERARGSRQGQAHQHRAVRRRSVRAGAGAGRIGVGDDVRVPRRDHSG